jgi:hypothetical protein
MPHLAIARGNAKAHGWGMEQPLPANRQRATQRPAAFAKPAHWTNAPAPAPRVAERGEDPDGLDPTRYGDWEKNGIAIDF